VLACATGTYAIGEAARTIHRGDAVVAVCGGTDAGVTALNAMAFGVIGAIAPPGDDPAQAVRPATTSATDRAAAPSRTPLRIAASPSEFGS